MDILHLAPFRSYTGQKGAKCKIVQRAVDGRPSEPGGRLPRRYSALLESGRRNHALWETVLRCTGGVGRYGTNAAANPQRGTGRGMMKYE
uniref:Uncharacterized protein n=1 Tax=Oryza brachyantha TaxID=4533 RepID=J3N5W1_ORYBR